MWDPRSEADITASVESGELRETHLLEIKLELGGSRGDRSEVARDLASLAVDGGRILVGLREDKTSGAFTQAPIRLSGVAESLEQIAELRVDPPLALSIREIPAEGSPDKGYLLVDVAPSPVAPHMVDGVYYGRGEKRRRRLGDAEVVRLHRTREDDASALWHRLDADISASPLPRHGARHAHLFVLLQPVSGGPSLAADIAWDEAALRNLIGAVEQDASSEWAPTGRYAHFVEPVDFGLSLGSIRPETYDDEQSALRVAIHEDGSVHVFMGRLSDHLEPRPGRPASEYVMDGLLTAWVDRAIGYALGVASATGYRGHWDVAVAGEGLAGLSAYSLVSDFLIPGRVSTHKSDRYRASTRATQLEMLEGRKNIVGRVLTRLHRTLGVAHVYESELGLR